MRGIWDKMTNENNQLENKAKFNWDWNILPQDVSCAKAIEIYLDENLKFLRRNAKTKEDIKKAGDLLSYVMDSEIYELNVVQYQIDFSKKARELNLLGIKGRFG
jgi:hypothetical protein